MQMMPLPKRSRSPAAGSVSERQECKSVVVDGQVLGPHELLDAAVKRVAFFG